MVTTLNDLIDDIRVRYSTNSEQGSAFERLIKQFLLTDPLYAQRFEHVWLWQEWPGRKGRPDTGIDLVAQDADGGVCAIQCKFYEPNHYLQKGDIDSFFTASGKAPFTERLIISTTERWSPHAEEALEGQHIPVARIGIADLASSAIDWSVYRIGQPDGMKLNPKKVLKPHQRAAIDDVFKGFELSDRGKLIMACGTGKTFTALKFAEELAHHKPDGAVRVLFLVPSISLLNQALREWTVERSLSMHSLGVCSDTKVGKASVNEDIRPHDLPFPATTDASALVKQVAEVDAGVELVVVFSTYQSIGTVAEAQERGLDDFDLIICDEAHRTTGVTLAGEDESAFVRVHDAAFLRASRRLYMTATPRLFDEGTKAKAQEHDALLCSMDDETLFGPEFHRLGFGKAVEAGLLTDYKVLVLNVDEGHIAQSFQAQLADENNELNLGDAAKIVGCWNGLAKRGGTLIAGDGFGDDVTPMRRAVAFSRTIKDSKALATKFEDLIASYTTDDAEALRCELDHVDGSHNALLRNEKLAWLQQKVDAGTCRILSNARCLSEGVDVPALDAVLFLNPRNSVVDVVQAVGRVMRRAEGKQYGYIILPVGIPAGIDPATALRDNKRYKVVWQVLQALRAHDDRFNAMVNQLELNKRDARQIDIIGVGVGEETVPYGDGSTGDALTQLHFPIEDWRDAIYARIVLKVGERTYWEQWADDIRLIAERHVTRIKASIAGPGSSKAEAFERFVAELRSNLNPGITAADAIDMLAQHLITKPVFDALFGSYAFSEHNPVSRTMQTMLDQLDDQALDKEAATLDSFYSSVRSRAEGIDNHEGRQAVITELYERFFKKALPKTADAFGIVYTPIPLVDFILRSTNQALAEYFDINLSAEGVQILDPFTGTGTFIVRMLQSGLIDPKDLHRKYTSELHANEILLLAYYIAAINIEATFHQLHEGDYLPFEGIVLTDTFQLAEDAASLDGMLFPENNRRVARQKAQDIRVIIGNPPYSTGQTSQNDANQNRAYPILDRRIEETYVAGSSAGLSRNMYDSYVRAIRWASDRIGRIGIVCYVSNGGWIDSNSADGLRKSLATEFDAIYVYNLRGNQRTSGEQSRREGGKVFGGGSRATVAITLLVRTGQNAKGCRIYYRDIGDYLSREEKLNIVSGQSLDSVEWVGIEPNESGDWINQRDVDFAGYVPISERSRKGEEQPRTIFHAFSNGVVTGRDAWCWNFSRAAVTENIERMVDFYNEQVAAFDQARKARDLPATAAAVDEFIDLDATKISWTRALKHGVRRGRVVVPDLRGIRTGSYRPFCKQALYLDRFLNETVSLQPQLFPAAGSGNLGFTLTGPSSHYEFSVIMVQHVPDLHLLDTGRFFPRYRYSQPTSEEGLLFDQGANELSGIDNVTDQALADYQATYGEGITKDDIFYGVYGLLHSTDYRTRYSADLHRMLPRVPKVREFEKFVTAGRQLAELHLGYESVEPYPLGDPSLEQLLTPPDELFRVERMTFAKGPQGTKDRSKIVFNRHIILTDIPDAAYRYMLGPKSAIEWIMDRYQVSTDRQSGIVNDPNTWCIEVGDRRYILDLVKRIVTVSLETMKIVDSLPPLNVIGSN